MLIPVHVVVKSCSVSLCCQGIKPECSHKGLVNKQRLINKGCGGSMMSISLKYNVINDLKNVNSNCAACLRYISYRRGKLATVITKRNLPGNTYVHNS